MEKTLKNKQHHTKESDFHDFNHDEEEGADFEGDIERREGFSAGSDKKIILLLAIGGVCIIAALIIVFVIVFQDSRKEREAVQAQMNLESMEQQPHSDEEAGTVPAQEEASDGQSAASSEPEEMPDVSAELEMQEEIQVGALDDDQDPQADGAAGTEANGAEVTVSAINKDETGSTTMGIDVSKYQGTIDWAQVKEAGVEFAMIRVGYRAKSTGELFEDPTARYNMQEAQAVGIKLGAYFFSSAVTQEEAKQEAAFTREIIAKYKITYPVAYNCEDFESPDSRQYGLDAGVRTSLACAFLDEIQAAGYTPMFYAAKGELEGSAKWDTQTLAGKYKIWVAQYPDQPYPATGASSYTGAHAMWQYTSQGTVAGIPKKTDVNIAYFGYTKEAEAKDETPAEVVEANPEVGIIFTEVNETVTAKQETNLRSEPSTLNDTSIVGKLVHGDTATRTGVGHNGWSRVIYNGQTLYAVTSYLTTNMEDTGQQAPPQGPVYTPVNESVTAKMETNLRTEPSTVNSDTVVGLLHNGEVLTRIAVGDNGWSQLDYNGQTVYAVSSYLTVVE
ncbi:MAG: glycoside hydrolase family 25 [Lachnospiraceae bacterium]|nr:glycoside hydrolase family 25 [Lachnospiraceae bacterium]